MRDLILPSGYTLCGDAAKMQIDAIHAYLAQSYWSSGIPREVVARAIAASVCAGVFKDDRQVGFARVVSDCATFAYLADVYVLDAHRGKGLARAMVSYMQTHPELQGLRRWMLMTRDAHTLYASLGWTSMPDPSIAMQRHFPNIYKERNA